MSKAITAAIIAASALTIYTHHYYAFALLACILIALRIKAAREPHIPPLLPAQNVST
jgi:hypothetical protein